MIIRIAVVGLAASILACGPAGERLALTSRREAGRQTLLFAPAGAGS
jgi:hypothetical protein